jgi:hypothetical protein
MARWAQPIALGIGLTGALGCGGTFEVASTSTGGGGATASTGAAGATASMGAAGTGGGGGEQCDPPTASPPGGVCPTACTGGCPTSTLCIIDCAGDNKCFGNKGLACPPFFDCEIHCQGKEACDEAAVQCPPTYACTLVCQGFEACEALPLTCTDGPCSVECGPGDAACKGTKLLCGSGPCSAACDGPSKPALEGCAGPCCTRC